MNKLINDTGKWLCSTGPSSNENGLTFTVIKKFTADGKTYMPGENFTVNSTVGGMVDLKNNRLFTAPLSFGGNYNTSQKDSILKLSDYLSSQPTNSNSTLRAATSEMNKTFFTLENSLIAVIIFFIVYRIFLSSSPSGN